MTFFFGTVISNFFKDSLVPQTVLQSMSSPRRATPPKTRIRATTTTVIPLPSTRGEWVDWQPTGQTTARNERREEKDASLPSTPSSPYSTVILPRVEKEGSRDLNYANENERKWKAKRCVMLFEAGHLPLSRAPAIHLLWVSTAASRRRMRPLFANGGRVAVEGGQGRPGGPPEGDTFSGQREQEGETDGLESERPSAGDKKETGNWPGREAGRGKLTWGNRCGRSGWRRKHRGLKWIRTSRNWRTGIQYFRSRNIEIYRGRMPKGGEDDGWEDNSVGTRSSGPISTKNAPYPPRNPLPFSLPAGFWVLLVCIHLKLVGGGWAWAAAAAAKFGGCQSWSTEVDGGGSEA